MNSLTTLFPPPGISNLVTAPSMYIHNIHHHNGILNINNISSQCHYQHQHPHISMALPTITTSSHINIIINNNIILYQHYHKHQRHLMSINTINNNITSKSHSAHTYIYSSCLRFTLPRSSDNTSLIKTIMSFINNRRITSH